MPFQLRVGVTGHRRLPPDKDLLDRVDEALRRALDLLTPLAETPVEVLVVSPLAEGADRLVAEVALARFGALLEVPLPLPVADYLEDFESAESRDAFRGLLDRASEVFVLPAVETREEAYEGAGRYVTERCDVLIALWDGEPARGLGGTADVVARARVRGIPVLWIHTGESCRLEVEINGGIAAATVQRFADFNGTRINPRRLRAHVTDHAARVREVADQTGLGQATVRPFVDWISSPFGRADLLARRYRTHYVRFGSATFILAALAVLAFAWQVYFAPDQTIFAWLGVVPLFALLGLLVLGRRWRLHERWISYRVLAERLRSAGFLALVGGRREEIGRRPYYYRSGAEDWQVRAFEAVWVRRPPPLDAEVDLAAIRRFVADGWLRDQLAYHCRSAARNRWLHDKLTRASEILCALTIVAALLYVLEVGGHDMSPRLTWATALLVLIAVLPAGAAALTGIRSQQEYLRNAVRSSRLIPYLTAILDRLDRARDLTGVRAIAYEADELMLWTDRDWFATMEFHNFELHV
ncbi:MAG TPA: hypothetical protein VHL09_05090 [Dehalococcoidia bacterium]|nr:hypothetical protein [Dehalococcoidia bacterium]